MPYLIALVFFGWIGTKVGHVLGYTEAQSAYAVVLTAAGLVAVMVAVMFLGLMTQILVLLGTTIAVLATPLVWLFRLLGGRSASREITISVRNREGVAEDDQGAEAHVATRRTRAGDKEVLDDLAFADEVVRLGGKRVFIEYCDIEGRETTRTVQVLGYTPPGLEEDEEISLIAAWCEKRRDYRTFLFQRVLSAADPDTGEIIDDFEEWLRAAGRKRSLRDTGRRPSAGAKSVDPGLPASPRQRMMPDGRQ